MVHTKSLMTFTWNTAQGPVTPNEYYTLYGRTLEDRVRKMKQAGNNIEQWVGAESGKPTTNLLVTGQSWPHNKYKVQIKWKSLPPNRKPATRKPKDFIHGTCDCPYYRRLEQDGKLPRCKHIEYCVELSKNII